MTRTEFWCVKCPMPDALDKHQIQASALDLSYFTSKSKCKFINLIHTRQKKNHLLMFVKNFKWNGFKMTLNIKNINNFTQWKNGSVDVTFARAITDQKHLAQSGRSLGAVRGVQWTFSIHSAYLLKRANQRTIN